MDEVVDEAVSPTSGSVVFGGMQRGMRAEAERRAGTSSRAG